MAQFVGTNAHTILLKQEGKEKTFSAHASFDQAVDSIISMYEAKLKELNPSMVRVLSLSAVPFSTPPSTVVRTYTQSFLIRLRPILLFLFSLPPKAHIQYDISDLYKYIDSMTDLTAMVLDKSTLQYQGVSASNIKKGILANLTKKAQGA
jgi:hypothetical protein